MKPIYLLHEVEQIYKKRKVLQVESLCVEANEILAIVGPSGAGKSTLLRLLGLLENPTNGHLDISIDGNNFTPQNATIHDRRQIAMVFQRPFLMSRTVFGNVQYGLQIRGRKDRDKVKQMLKRVSLSDLSMAKAQTLSGGEMQRVAVARALVTEPRVLLLDEPTANLDPYNVRIIEDLVHEQHQLYDTTIVLITHNIHQAQRLATRVALMLNGEIIEVTDNRTFFNTPRDPRTKAFLSGELVC